MQYSKTTSLIVNGLVTNGLNYAICKKGVFLNSFFLEALGFEVASQKWPPSEKGFKTKKQGGAGT